jgi:hypothetical protein
MPRIASSIVNFLKPEQKYSAAMDILSQFSSSATVVETSYTSSSIEALLLPIPGYWVQISADAIMSLFLLGYLVQSSSFADVIMSWLADPANSSESLIMSLSSAQMVWKSKQITALEAKVFCKLAIQNEKFGESFRRKLSDCDANLESLRNILPSLRLTFQSTDICFSNSGLEDSIRKILERWEPILQRTLEEQGFSQPDFELLENYLQLVADIDLEKWVGLVCKYDLENLVPRGISAIEAIFKRNMETYHRRLPGWVAGTLSRFTRRFAEDKELSDDVLHAINAFGNIS